MPVMDQGKMNGILYLENSTISGAFTPERVEVLGIVSEILANAWARNKAEEELLAHRDQLRSLSTQMLLTEERERRRIAIDLHDRIGHALANIMLKLGELRHFASSLNSNGLLDEISFLVERCITDSQSLTFEISPPILYDLGLEAAIDWLVEKTREEHKINIEFENDGLDSDFDESIRILLFRAIRELLFNMVKYSGATSARVHVGKVNKKIKIGIEDDGIGFDVNELRSSGEKKGGFGLFSIRERLTRHGGSLEIDSAPGKGTRITIISPGKVMEFE